MIDCIECKVSTESETPEAEFECYRLDDGSVVKVSELIKTGFADIDLVGVRVKGAAEPTPVTLPMWPRWDPLCEPSEGFVPARAFFYYEKNVLQYGWKKAEAGWVCPYCVDLGSHLAVLAMEFNLPAQSPSVEFGVKTAPAFRDKCLAHIMMDKIPDEVAKEAKNKDEARKETYKDALRKLAVKRRNKSLEKENG
jgi:hypothetical protein